MAGRKYDAEDLLETIYQIMTDNTALNTQIAAVEAEKIAAGKGLTPTLAQVASGSYYLQTWSDKILNTNPSIFYGIEDVSVVDGGSVAAKTYKIFVEIVLIDNGQTNDIHKRIYRYSRAIEELFEANFGPAIAGGKVKIEAVRPVSLKLALDSDEEIKVGGVSLNVTLV